MNLFQEAERLHRRCLDTGLSEEDLVIVCRWPREHLAVLFAASDQVRRSSFGASIEPCAIMNIKSGGCTEDCAFCSQSSHNAAEVKTSPLRAAPEIVDAYRKARERGLSFGVVSSGKGLSPRELDRLVEALEECGGPTHASLGILNENQLRRLREAGVVCYNHNLETGRRFFPRIVGTHDYRQRIETVRRAKAAGMRVCCGGIFGLGESWEDRKELCLQLRDLDVDTIPLNFFNPVAGTRLPPPRESPWELLKIIALFRLAHPRRHIKVCGGREFHLGRLQPLMFLAGADGFISGNYLTTTGDSAEADEELARLMNLRKEGDVDRRRADSPAETRG